MKQLALFVASLVSGFGLSVQAQTCVSVCPSQGLTTEFEWIRGVDLDGGLFNLSGDNGGYADFGTEFGGTYNAGGVYFYTVVAGYGDGPFSETWRGWMDFNQDGDFDDADELIFSNFGQSAVSGTFSVPSSALNGLTRLRVAMSFAIVPGCGDFPEGEVEDYCVTVTGGVDPVCDASSPVAGLASTVGASEVVLTWNPVPASVGCQVSGGPVPSFSRKVRQLGANISSVSIPASILTPGTYNWKVNCACAITPSLVLTPDSAVDTFSIPSSRLASSAAQDDKPFHLSAAANNHALTVNLEAFEAAQQVFLVTDMLGRPVYRGAVAVAPGLNYFEIDLASLSSGIYLVAYLQDGELVGSAPIILP